MDKNTEKIEKLQTFYSSCFYGVRYFDNDGSNLIRFWKSNFGCLVPKLDFIYNAKIGIEFKGGCLKQDKTTFIHRNVTKLFIAYELDAW